MTSSEPAHPRERRPSAQHEAPESAERPEDVLLNTAQVAKLLQVTPKRVLELVNVGVIPAHRLPGMHYRYFRQRILDAFAENPVLPGEVEVGGPKATGTVNAER